MCYSTFSKVLIGEDRMIICRKEDLKKVNIQNLIRKAFPELYPEKSFFNFFKRPFEHVEYKIECCYKMYSSRFDCQVGSLEKGNNWKENPFIALNVFEKAGEIYCGARPVEM